MLPSKKKNSHTDFKKSIIWVLTILAFKVWISNIYSQEQNLPIRKLVLEREIMNLFLYIYIGIYKVVIIYVIKFTLKSKRVEGIYKLKFLNFSGLLGVLCACVVKFWVGKQCIFWSVDR